MSLKSFQNLFSIVRLNGTCFTQRSKPSPLNLCSCFVHLNCINLRPITNPSPSSCSVGACVCVCVCVCVGGYALSVTSGAFLLFNLLHTTRGECVYAFFVCVYVCCCRAIIAEGLALTALCVYSFSTGVVCQRSKDLWGWGTWWSVVS